MVLRNLIPTPTLLRVTFYALLLTAYSALVVWLDVEDSAGLSDLPVGLEAAVSLAISLVLALRVNRAFDRWWEGRILWGTLVNACRNLAIKINNLVVKDDAAERDLTVKQAEELIVAFPIALRDHLRGRAQVPSIPGINEEEPVAHVPSWIVNHLYRLVIGWKRAGRIGDEDFRVIDLEAKVLLEVCGGCERIRNTPIVHSFRVLLMQALALFLITLPWTVVHEFHWWTVPIMFVASYLALAADGIAEHVEHPFGEQPDALELDPICETINQTVREIFKS